MLMDDSKEEKDKMSAPGEAAVPEYSTRIALFLKELFEGEIVSFGYIGNRYSCHRKMTEIERLRTKETELRYEATTLSSELTGVSRPSQIEKLFEEKGIDIHAAKTPSYKLKRKKYEE